MPEPVVVKLRAIDVTGEAMPKSSEYEPPLLLRASVEAMSDEEIRRRIAKGAKIVLLANDKDLGRVLTPQIEYMAQVLESRLENREKDNG